MMKIFIISILCAKLSYQAGWKPHFSEDEESQQQEPRVNIPSLNYSFFEQDTGACASTHSISPPVEDAQYISRQFDEVFANPEKCFSYYPENKPSDVINLRNRLQMAFDEQQQTDQYFKNLQFRYEDNPANPDFVRIGSCYTYTLNVGDTKLQLMPPQTSDDYAYESNCETINMDNCSPESLKNALMAIKKCSNLHLVIHNFKAEALQKAIFLVKHGLVKEVRFISGDLTGNMDITGILVGNVTRVVVDVDKLGTGILSILCMRGIRRLDISFNRLVLESSDPISLLESCESLRISSNDYRTIEKEKLIIVIMEDSTQKKKKEIECNSKSITFIPQRYLRVTNLTLAFEDEECVGLILKNTLKLKNLKLILRSLNKNLEFLKQTHLKNTLIQMELIIRQPYSGKKSELTNILKFYKGIKNIALGIDFAQDCDTSLSFEEIQERLNTLSLHSNTLESEFPLNPENANNLQALDMQWEKNSKITDRIPGFLARFDNISDCILENVPTRKFWEKIEDLETVKSLMIKNPIDRKIKSNEMAPLYKSMRKLTISLTPRALSLCKFTLDNLEEFNLSIVSGEIFIESAELEEIFSGFCARHFSIPKNLIRLNLNQYCDFSMLAICEYPFPKLVSLNIERCLYTNTAEEEREVEIYFDSLAMFQRNDQIHANITFSSSRSYSNKNRY